MVVYVGTKWYIMVYCRITLYIAVLVGILKIQKLSITLRIQTQYLLHTDQHTQPLSYERCFLGLNIESRRYMYCFFTHSTLFHRPAPAPAMLEGKLEFEKGKETDWGTISNPVRNLGDHNCLCNF